MAFPTTPILDNFNRANGGPGANWITPAFGDGFAFTIDTNQLLAHDAATGAAWVAAQYGPDVEVYATIPTLPTAGVQVSLNIRYTQTGASPNGYLLDAIPSSGAWTLFLMTAGVPASIATGSQVVSAGDSFGLSAVGTRITAYYKAAAGSWASVVTVVNSSVTTAGYIGVEGNDLVTRLDDFGGGTITSIPISWLYV